MHTLAHAHTARARTHTHTHTHTYRDTLGLLAILRTCAFVKSALRENGAPATIALTTAHRIPRLLMHRIKSSNARAQLAGSALQPLPAPAKRATPTLTARATSWSWSVRQTSASSHSCNTPATPHYNIALRL